MQRPPAASVSVLRSPRLGRILLTITLGFAGVPLYGWYAGMVLSRVFILALVWCIASVWLAHFWRNMPQGLLHWDGEYWLWSGVSEPLQSVVIQYDFQSSLWLRLVPARGCQFGMWVDADPQRMPQWRAIRRALVGAGFISTVSKPLPFSDKQVL